MSTTLQGTPKDGLIQTVVAGHMAEPDRMSLNRYEKFLVYHENVAEIPNAGLVFHEKTLTVKGSKSN